MSSWIGAAFLVLGSIILIRLFGLVDKSADVATTARRALGVIRNSNLSIETKETALQKNAKELFGLLLVLTLGGAAALLIPVGILWVCDRLERVSLDSVFSVALSPLFLITSGALAVIALSFPRIIIHKRNQYSALDRGLHRVAFRTYRAQAALADFEDRLFAGKLSACQSDRPVFITALPRAGTTLLLEACAKLPDFASHCYRDMPFILIPCLWNRFSKKFQLAGDKRERAHGDDMLIDFDSPEALEEVLWKTSWPQQYGSDRIIPWQIQEHPEFYQFFRTHMRKIILLRRGNLAPTARYLSKNNLNIARAGLLHRLFPDSTIVVPFREPMQQAASLLAQHRNFLSIHREDPFASEYMRSIGHFDFGQNLRPIDFDRWLDKRSGQDPEHLAFWLEYWVAAYRHLFKESADILHFIDYQELCREPKLGLQVLADAIGTRHPEELLSAAASIRRLRHRQVDAGAVPLSILQQANELYAGLKSVALS